MKIEAGKYYRTRAGRKIKLLSTEGVFPYVGIGAHVTAKGLGDIGNWCDDGFVLANQHEHPDDVVAEWVDKPEFDWSVIPPWLNYLAMDGNLTWYLYASKPTFSDTRWDPEADADICKVPKQYAPCWTGRPEDSLVERNPTK